MGLFELSCLRSRRIVVLVCPRKTARVHPAPRWCGISAKRLRGSIFEILVEYIVPINTVHCQANPSRVFIFTYRPGAFCRRRFWSSDSKLSPPSIVEPSSLRISSRSAPSITIFSVMALVRALNFARNLSISDCIRSLKCRLAITICRGKHRHTIFRYSTRIQHYLTRK